MSLLLRTRVNCVLSISHRAILNSMPHGGRRPGAGRPRKAPPRSSLDTAILRAISEVSGYTIDELTALGPRCLLDLIRHHGVERLVEIEDEPEAGQLGFLKTMASPPDLPTSPTLEPEEPQVEVILKNDLSVNAIRYGPRRCEVPLRMKAWLEHLDRQAEHGRRMSPVWQDHLSARCP